jgi:hypothetical protein
MLLIKMRMNRPRMLAYIPTVRLAAGLALTVLTVTACGSGGSSDVSQSGTSTTPNRAPSIQSFDPEEILEGSQLSVAIVSSDPDGDSLDRSISGPDTPFFTINEEDFIELAVLPDWEAREDADANNIFEITLTVSDGDQSASANLEVTLVDALEGTVVDGVMSGATVFIDINNNSVLDNDEVSTETDSSGVFFLPYVALLSTRGHRLSRRDRQPHWQCASQFSS